jgi:hypothetical protein
LSPRSRSGWRASSASPGGRSSLSCCSRRGSRLPRTCSRGGFHRRPTVVCSPRGCSRLRLQPRPLRVVLRRFTRMRRSRTFADERAREGERKKEGTQFYGWSLIARYSLHYGPLFAFRSRFLYHFWLCFILISSTGTIEPFNSDTLIAIPIVRNPL